MDSFFKVLLNMDFILERLLVEETKRMQISFSMAEHSSNKLNVMSSHTTNNTGGGSLSSSIFTALMISFSFL